MKIFSRLIPEREAEPQNFGWEALSPTNSNMRNGAFSVIDHSTTIQGNFVSCTAYIHGKINGSIFAENVTVEATGRVSGAIFCKTLSVYGTVTADIICESVIVRADATLTGKLKYVTLKLEAGANVSGTFEFRPCFNNLPKAPLQTSSRASRPTLKWSE